MTDTLKHKEDFAIKLLKAIPGDDIELAYSGGKDSDVILYLARLAGIPVTPIYKNTTIDPPGTIKRCNDNGAQILQPQSTFFELIERHGFPSRWVRFCCSVLKEYKVKDHAILGVRQAESTRRAKMYKEPQICRVYSKNSKVKQYLPILYWTDKDVEEYISVNNIKLHPLYYDDNGRVDCRRRLGCMGCPMKSDNGLSDFKRYPRLLRQWIKHGQVWLDTHPDLKTHKYFSDIYALMACRLFFDSNPSYFAPYDKPTLFGRENWKARLEEYFHVNL